MLRSRPAMHAGEEARGASSATRHSARAPGVRPDHRACGPTTAAKNPPAKAAGLALRAA